MSRKALIPTLAACALLGAALLGASPVLPGPEVRISDAGAGRIEIEAHNASLDQVLDALRASHLIQFAASDPLAGSVTGTYTGTLPQVLSRLLNGHNYFLQVTPSGTKLHIVSVAPSAAVTSPVPAAVPMTPNLGQQQRRPK